MNARGSALDLPPHVRCIGQPMQAEQLSTRQGFFFIRIFGASASVGEV
jgi:hypothetical protein